MASNRYAHVKRNTAHMMVTPFGHIGLHNVMASHVRAKNRRFDVKCQFSRLTIWTIGMRGTRVEYVGCMCVIMMVTRFERN